MYLLHLNSRESIAITGSLCYNYNCSGARVAGRFALETPSNQHNIVLWAKRPPYGDSRPAVRLNTDGNHTEGALIMDTQKEYRTCPECGELFMPTGKGIYCGPICRSAGRVKWTPVRGLPEPVFTCPSCGKEYRPTTASQHRCRECINQSTKRGRFLILERDNFRCIYCGESSIENRIKLHVDHIVPRSKGGTSRASNLVTSCQRCNLEKSTNLLNPEIQDRIKSIVRERNTNAGINGNKVIKLKRNDSWE